MWVSWAEGVVKELESWLAISVDAEVARWEVGEDDEVGEERACESGERWQPGMLS